LTLVYNNRNSVDAISSGLLKDIIFCEFHKSHCPLLIAFSNTMIT